MQQVHEWPWGGVTVVGCPVYERGFVLDYWFSALRPWVEQISVEFVFVYTESQDRTLEIIYDWTLKLGVPCHIIDYNEGTHSVKRNWGDAERLKTLAAMRNLLLQYVRERQPDFYFSLDSDILVPSWMEGGQLWEALTPQWGFSAVAPLAFLGSGSITNAFTTDRHRRQRAKVYGAVQPVDVICAAKLMTPDVFMDRRVNYGYHTHGEDIYWSNAARGYGHSLAIDTRVKCKHIMRPEQLGRVDERVGW